MKKLLFLMLLFLTNPAFSDVAKKIDTPQNREILTKVETAYNKIKT